MSFLNYFSNLFLLLLLLILITFPSEHVCFILFVYSSGTFFFCFHSFSSQELRIVCSVLSLFHIFVLLIPCLFLPFSVYISFALNCPLLFVLSLCFAPFLCGAIFALYFILTYTSLFTYYLLL